MADEEMEIEPNVFDMSSLLKLLQGAKKVAPILKTHTHSIRGVRRIDSVLVENFANEMKYAIEQTTIHSGYNAAASYDCKWLCEQALIKIQQAQGNGSTSVLLENRCCTNDNCPEVHLMKCFIDRLKN